MVRRTRNVPPCRLHRAPAGLLTSRRGRFAIRLGLATARTSRFTRISQQGRRRWVGCFAHHDPSNYAFETRSLRIAGHSTSVRLETLFWTMLEEMAASEGMSLGKFLTKLSDEVLELHGSAHNFASSPRCSCLIYLRSRRRPTYRALPSRSAKSLPPHSTERHHRRACNGGGRRQASAGRPLDGTIIGVPIRSPGRQISPRCIAPAI